MKSIRIQEFRSPITVDMIYNQIDEDILISIRHADVTTNSDWKQMHLYLQLFLYFILGFHYNIVHFSQLAH